MLIVYIAGKPEKFHKFKVLYQWHSCLLSRYKVLLDSRWLHLHSRILQQHETCTACTKCWKAFTTCNKHWSILTNMWPYVLSLLFILTMLLTPKMHAYYWLAWEKAKWQTKATFLLKHNHNFCFLASWRGGITLIKVKC